MARQTRGNGNAVTVAAKTRRPHKKSRKGCAECKRRHIRCDERQPTCVNCETIEHACSFLLLGRGGIAKQRQKQGQGQKRADGAAAAAAVSPGSQLSGNSNTSRLSTTADGEQARLLPTSAYRRSLMSPYDCPNPGSSSTNESHAAAATAANPYQIPSPASPVLPGDVRTHSADAYPGLLSAPTAAAPAKAIYTPQHMILLHHARAVPNFTARNRNIVDIAIQHVIASPYLLDEVLAYTAFHMSLMYPGSAEYLCHVATELQTRGLTSFRRITELVPHNDKPSAVPRFLFASLLGYHVFLDALTYCRRNDLHLFIERFVEGLNVNRGIMSVIPPAKDFLSDSEMQPFLQVVIDAGRHITTPGTECDPLNRLIDKSDLGEASVEACRKAIETLQLSFDLCRHLDVADHHQSISVFIVKVDASFAELLRKHVSESLVILAFLGVLLHRCRHFWGFGDAGAALVRGIHHLLSGYWHEALEWPLHVLETEPITATSDANTVTAFLSLLDNAEPMKDVIPALVKLPLLGYDSRQIRKFGQRIQKILQMKLSLKAINSTGTERPGGSHSNDIANFRHISVYPTSDEFASAHGKYMALIY
ncbi:hypothetical protein QQS21_002490 [Conoideocrella luteorostrata]|uniref:Zn(2)-C6 fungal-type domain-containing protein n=1 Tax=Conoideocrella luteorostrata TaxID=1105319 RepID=A0AAJ0G194_9HYPO|nr:hypothetical protein QQS21_002490 [Conoideocrella luteorostrata]